MKVYALVKESYFYWDGDYETKIELFSNKQDAINYLNIVKESSLEDVYREIYDLFENNNLEFTETNLAILAERYEDDPIYEFSNKEDYFRVYIEEWGYDEYYILEKNVMECGF